MQDKEQDLEIARQLFSLYKAYIKEELSDKRIQQCLAASKRSNAG